jgi:surface antigen
LRRLFGIVSALLIAMGVLRSGEAQALQCVPFAREQSGIVLRGDAWTWWMAAAGQYERGQTPRRGAVMVFKKYGAMSHGHVAVVAIVVNARKVLVDHANWAPHRGRGRGQVTTKVMMTDVSPRNDWSEVRVWNAASGELGTKTYPTYGFIYPHHASGDVGMEASLAVQSSLAESFSSYDDQGTSPFGETHGGFHDSTGIGAIASLTDLLTPQTVSSAMAIAPGIVQ